MSSSFGNDRISSTVDSRCSRFRISASLIETTRRTRAPGRTSCPHEIHTTRREVLSKESGQCSSSQTHVMSCTHFFAADRTPGHGGRGALGCTSSLAILPFLIPDFAGRCHWCLRYLVATMMLKYWTPCILSQTQVRLFRYRGMTS